MRKKLKLSHPRTPALCLTTALALSCGLLSACVNINMPSQTAAPAAETTVAPTAAAAPSDPGQTQTSASLPESTAAQAISSSGTGSAGDDSSAALQTALTHAGLTRDAIHQLDIEPDRENSFDVFSVEFTGPDGSEYEYEIIRSDYAILSFSQDFEDALPRPADDGAILEEAPIRQSMLELVPGASEDSLFLRLDQDDYHPEYKGRLTYQNMRYEFEFDARSGALLQWEGELQTG